MTTFVDKRPNKGRCVFANKDFQLGELIESNHIIELSYEPDNDYVITWTEETGCIALGVINLMNHSETPNVKLVRNYDKNMMEAYALAPIKTGEELCFRYKCEIWFDAV